MTTPDHYREGIAPLLTAAIAFCLVSVNAARVGATATPTDAGIDGGNADLAFNLNPGTPSSPDFPTSFESDPGWGGGAKPEQIIDGYRGCDDPSGWACGLAFTGGEQQLGWASVRRAPGHHRSGHGPAGERGQHHSRGCN